MMKSYSENMMKVLGYLTEYSCIIHILKLKKISIYFLITEYTESWENTK
jgi:hypothetical protein